MKIKIEFEQEEKESIMDAIGQPIEKDNNEIVEGKFGFMSYNKNGTIEINLVPDFIKAFTGLIRSVVNFIGSIIPMIESFSDKWSADTVIKEFDDNGKLIYYRESNYTEWNKYDDRGNCIYHKNSNGVEWNKYYDENDRIISEE